MKIVTFKMKLFEGHPIYIRRVGTYFEYVTMIGDDLYSSHQIVKPSIFERILFWTGIRDDLYTHEQVIFIQKYLETLAMGTIKSVARPKPEVVG